MTTIDENDTRLDCERRLRISAEQRAYRAESSEASLQRALYQANERISQLEATEAVRKAMAGGAHGQR